MTTRCDWASDPLMHDYHDLEWGVPVHDDGGCSSPDPRGRAGRAELVDDPAQCDPPTARRSTASTRPAVARYDEGGSPSS
jgi:hypothetical protein